MQNKTDTSNSMRGFVAYIKMLSHNDDAETDADDGDVAVAVIGGEEKNKRNAHTRDMRYACISHRTNREVRERNRKSSVYNWQQ